MQDSFSTESRCLYFLTTYRRIYMVKRICCSLLALSIVFSASVCATSASSEHSQNTPVSVELPLTAVDTHDTNSTYNSIDINFSGLEGIVLFTVRSL